MLRRHVNCAIQVIRTVENQLEFIIVKILKDISLPNPNKKKKMFKASLLIVVVSFLVLIVYTPQAEGSLISKCIARQCLESAAEL